MKKILLIVVATAILAVFILFKADTTKSSASDLSYCKVYTYQDKFYNGIGRHCLNTIVLKGIYFVAKDQTSEIVANWQTNMKDIFQKTKNFYESQFDNKIQITAEEPRIVYGDKNIGDYASAWAVEQEVINKLQIGLSNNYFLALTIYYNSPSGSYSGGGTWGSVEDNGSITANPAFWLQSSSLCTVTTKYGTDCFGYINSGHEFGHSLGMAHPWDMDINKDSGGNIIDPSFHYTDSGNIMAYNSGPLISGNPSNPFGGYYVMSEIKQKMINTAPTPTPSPTCYSWMPCWTSPTPTPNINADPDPSPTPTPTPSCYWWEGQCQSTPTPTPTPITPKVEAIRFSGDSKVYVVQGSVIKWVPSPDVFNSLGLNWASVEVVPASQKTNFQRAKLLRAENDQKVYYITEGGLKRHIPNIETFNSYGNLWRDVVVVKDFELSAIADNQLIRQTGDSKVYKLENGQKRWIKTAEAFNRLGLNWAQIAPVNSVEINSYTEGNIIE